jgi:hypothetical protein
MKPRHATTTTEARVGFTVPTIAHHASTTTARFRDTTITVLVMLRFTHESTIDLTVMGELTDTAVSVTRPRVLGP